MIVNLGIEDMRFFSKVFSLVRHDGVQKNRPDTITYATVTHDEEAVMHRVAELEQHIEHQNRQIARARSLLQNAAFLAGYHQPSLERDIRILLREFDTKDPQHGTSPATARDWPLPPSSGSTTVSA